MNSFLQDARLFVNREKLYSLLFVFLCLTYAVIVLFTQNEEEPPSPALERIKAIETVLKDDAAEKKYFATLSEERPLFAALLGVGTIAVICIMGCGVFILISVFVAYRRRQTVFKVLYESKSVSWGMSDVVKVLILFLFISMTTGIAISVLSRLWYSDALENMLLIVHTTVTDLVMAFLVLHFVVKERKSTLRDVGLNVRCFMDDVGLGALAYCAILPLFVGTLVCLGYIVECVQYDPPPHPLIDIFLIEDKRNPALIGVSLLLACVIGPIVEEIFFRGFCYNALKKRWGVSWAMVTTAGFFAAIHESLFAFLPIFLLGLALAYLYEKRGTLIPSIALHVIHNSLFIGYFFTMKSVFLDRMG